MSFVPYSKDLATLEQKHKIRKMLEYIGITDHKKQVQFMSGLLDKPFFSSKMSYQDFLTLRSKIISIQQTEKKTKA